MSSKNKLTFIQPELTVEDLSKALYSANLDLQSANDRLEKQQESQRQLLSNLSHDLRAPLAAVYSNVEYLQSLSTQELTPNQLTQSLDVISQKLRDATNLLDQILTLNKLDDSEMEIHFQSIPLYAFLEDYYFQQLVDQRFANRKLHLNLPSGAHAPGIFPPTDTSGGCAPGIFSPDTASPDLMIDITLFKRVLDNLFSNALKYSDTDDTIELSAFSDAAGHHVLIRDTGYGISLEDLPHIFDRSYIGNDNHHRNPSTDGNSSHGLGLAIVQDILLRHNARISCESQIGVGTTFHIVF